VRRDPFPQSVVVERRQTAMATEPAMHADTLGGLEKFQALHARPEVRPGCPIAAVTADRVGDIQESPTSASRGIAT